MGSSTSRRRRRRSRHRPAGASCPSRRTTAPSWLQRSGGTTRCAHGPLVRTGLRTLTPSGTRALPDTHGGKQGPEKHLSQPSCPVVATVMTALPGWLHDHRYIPEAARQTVLVSVPAGGAGGAGVLTSFTLMAQNGQMTEFGMPDGYLLLLSVEPPITSGVPRPARGSSLCYGVIGTTENVPPFGPWSPLPLAEVLVVRGGDPSAGNANFSSEYRYSGLPS